MRDPSRRCAAWAAAVALSVTGCETLLGLDWQPADDTAGADGIGGADLGLGGATIGGAGRRGLGGAPTCPKCDEGDACVGDDDCKGKFDCIGGICQDD
jgi:hypothetical protein